MLPIRKALGFLGRGKQKQTGSPSMIETIATSRPADPSDPAQRVRSEFAVVSAYILLVGACAAGLLVAKRGNLGSPPGLVACVLGLLALAATAPLALPLSAWRGELRGALPTLAVVVAYFVPVAALVAGLQGWWWCWALAVPGLARMAGALRSRIERGVLLFWLTAPLLAFHLFAEVQGRGYAHALAPEFAAAGLLHRDTYYLTAVAHLVERTLTPSIGADGLVPLHYHVASHYWFAGLAELSTASIIQTFVFAQFVAAIPLMLGLLLMAARMVSGPGRSIVRLAWVALLLVALFDVVGLNSYYVSESYTAGLVVLLAAIPLLARIPRIGALSTKATLALAALCCVLVFVAGAAKVSVGLLLGATLGWLLLRRFGLRLANLIGCAALAATLLAVSACFNSSNVAADQLIAPLSFYLEHRLSTTLPSLLLPGLLLFSAARSGWLDGAPAPPTRRLLFEGLALFWGLALLPTLLLNIAGGSAWYFQNVPHWLALVFVVPLAADRLDTAAARWTAGRWRVVAALVVVVVVARGGWRIVKASRSVARQLEAAALDAPPHYGARLAAVVGAFTARHPRRAHAVFVPPTNRAFWSFPRGCISRSHVIPALTGVPMLLGLPPAGDDCVLEARGYMDYDDASRSRVITPEALCVHARARAITNVLVLYDVDDPTANRELDCHASAAVER